jgi:DNA polymerase-3 subunit gamma/tau
MSYTVLARKYRPQKFSEVIGQEHVTRTLQNAIEQGRTAHGYIFSGHRGIGKTTVARILAAALNCRSKDHPVPEPCGICESCTEIRAGSSVDVIEIDAATNRGIDEIRELREAARYRPARDRFKIYILDEAHQITDAAFNALLKTLEEPPDHIVFMLATTQPEDIPQTIRSRCQHFSFRAVKFDDIVGQLRDLVGREKIEADDDALALLAEAGDGSMRDALSILDQAIASSNERLTADSVRNLVGAAPAHILEQVMQAVSQSQSQEILQHVDHLISEGHSPTHFARQIVRFLRNATVAKIAGKDSALLQISSEERERVARVAEMFSEEDLTRHLQIMLRTHGELGYKQEQRFHLELGLLKMAHAQKLLPIEQLLSEVGSGTLAGGSSGQGSSAQRNSVDRPPARPAIVSGASGADPRRSEPTNARSNFVSPFAADSARKGTPRQEDNASASPAAGPRIVAASSQQEPVIMGSAVPSVMAETSVISEAAAIPDRKNGASEVAVATPIQAVREPQPIAPPRVSAPIAEPRIAAPQAETKVETAGPTVVAAVAENLASAHQSPTAQSTGIDRLQAAVLQTLVDSNQRILVSMLSDGQWSLEGNEVVIRIAESQTIIDMSMSAEAKRLAIASASGVLGGPARLRIVPGATIAPGDKKGNGGSRAPQASGGPGGRGRAEQDPIVRRMQEKFGAEIRTVIDYRDQK